MTNSIKKPLVSVITPAYNAEKFIERSVKSILRQTYSNIEYIILDDSSTDNTYKILKKLQQTDERIKLIKNRKNLYISANRNKGIKLATGKYILWQDADDYSYPYRIEKLVNFMESNPDVGICGGYIESYKGGKVIDTRYYPLEDESLRKNIFKFSPVAQPAAIVRAECFERLGNYNPLYAPAEDIDMSFRIGTEYKFANIPEVLIKYTEHETSATFNNSRKQVLSTLEVRRKFSKDPNYTFSKSDSLAYFMSWIFQYIPTSFTIKIFKAIKRIYNPGKSRRPNVIVISHKYTHQPDDDLVKFLSNNNYKDVLHIMHEFNDARSRRSRYKWYRDGELLKSYESYDFKFLKIFEPFIYLKEFIYSFIFIIFSGVRWDKYVALDGLCLVYGKPLKLLGPVVSDVYWVIDFVPFKRFTSGIKNYIYRQVNLYALRSSDQVWDLSPVMHEARNKYLGIDKSYYKSHSVVQHGIWHENIKKVSYEDCKRNTVVFMGHLIKKQGLQDVIRALPIALKSNKNISLRIIGDGNYREELQQLALNLGVAEVCEFMGRIESHQVVEKLIAECALGVATYKKTKDSWTYYADPGKIKVYLGCGVPVLLTDITWNAKEIKEYECGDITTGAPENLASKLIELLDPSRNVTYRNNAVEYSKRFDYNKIFAGLLI